MRQERMVSRFDLSDEDDSAGSVGADAELGVLSVEWLRRCAEPRVKSFKTNFLIRCERGLRFISMIPLALYLSYSNICGYNFAYLIIIVYTIFAALMPPSPASLSAMIFGGFPAGLLAAAVMCGIIAVISAVAPEWTPENPQYRKRNFETVVSWVIIALYVASIIPFSVWRTGPLFLALTIPFYAYIYTLDHMITDLHGMLKDGVTVTFPTDIVRMVLLRDLPNLATYIGAIFGRISQSEGPENQNAAGKLLSRTILGLEEKFKNDYQCPVLSGIVRGQAFKNETCNFLLGPNIKNLHESLSAMEKAKVFLITSYYGIDVHFELKTWFIKLMWTADKHYSLLRGLLVALALALALFIISLMLPPPRFSRSLLRSKLLSAVQTLKLHSAQLAPQVRGRRVETSASNSELQRLLLENCVSDFLEVSVVPVHSLKKKTKSKRSKEKGKNSYPKTSSNAAFQTPSTQYPSPLSKYDSPDHLEKLSRTKTLRRTLQVTPVFDTLILNCDLYYNVATFASFEHCLFSPVGACGFPASQRIVQAIRNSSTHHAGIMNVLRNIDGGSQWLKWNLDLWGAVLLGAPRTANFWINDCMEDSLKLQQLSETTIGLKSGISGDRSQRELLLETRTQLEHSLNSMISRRNEYLVSFRNGPPLKVLILNEMLQNLPTQGASSDVSSVQTRVRIGQNRALLEEFYWLYIECPLELGRSSYDWINGSGISNRTRNFFVSIGLFVLPLYMLIVGTVTPWKNFLVWVLKTIFRRKKYPISPHLARKRVGDSYATTKVVNCVESSGLQSPISEMGKRVLSRERKKRRLSEFYDFCVCIRFILGTTLLMCLVVMVPQYSERIWMKAEVDPKTKSVILDGLLQARIGMLSVSKTAPWTLLGFLTCFFNTTQGTAKRCLLRALGVSTGCLFGWLCLLAFPTNVWLHGIWLCVTEFIVVALAADCRQPQAGFHPSWGYAAQLFTYQQTIIIVESFLSRERYPRNEIVLARLIGQGTGILTALLTAVFILPTPANKALRHDLGDCICSLRTSAHALANLASLSLAPGTSTDQDVTFRSWDDYYTKVSRILRKDLQHASQVHIDNSILNELPILKTNPALTRIYANCHKMATLRTQLYALLMEARDKRVDIEGEPMNYDCSRGSVRKSSIRRLPMEAVMPPGFSLRTKHAMVSLRPPPPDRAYGASSVIGPQSHEFTPHPVGAQPPSSPDTMVATTSSSPVMVEEVVHKASWSDDEGTVVHDGEMVSCEPRHGPTTLVRPVGLHASSPHYYDANFHPHDFDSSEESVADSEIERQLASPKQGGTFLMNRRGRRGSPYTGSRQPPVREVVIAVSPSRTKRFDGFGGSEAAQTPRTPPGPPGLPFSDLYNSPSMERDSRRRAALPQGAFVERSRGADDANEDALRRRETELQEREARLRLRERDSGDELDRLRRELEILKYDKEVCDRTHAERSGAAPENDEELQRLRSDCDRLQRQNAEVAKELRNEQEKLLAESQALENAASTSEELQKQLAERQEVLEAEKARLSQCEEELRRQQEELERLRATTGGKLSPAPLSGATPFDDAACVHRAFIAQFTALWEVMERLYVLTEFAVHLGGRRRGLLKCVQYKYTCTDWISDCNALHAAARSQLDELRISTAVCQVVHRYQGERTTAKAAAHNLDMPQRTLHFLDCLLEFLNQDLLYLRAVQNAVLQNVWVR